MCGEVEIVNIDLDVDWKDQEVVFVCCVEFVVMKGIFGMDMNCWNFLCGVGSVIVFVVVLQFVLFDLFKVVIIDVKGLFEKIKFNVGFVLIICVMFIIMVKLFGFYEWYGLDVDVIKIVGWVVFCDKFLLGEYDVVYMLMLMLFVIIVGVGFILVFWIMFVVENINGQVIILVNKYFDKQDLIKWKGFIFGVLFEYFMYNFLFCYYVVEVGFDFDKDIQICVVLLLEMVVNLFVGNFDGYFFLDFFNQCVVFDGVGFIYKLIKEIWDGYFCCVFVVSQKFIDQMLNMFLVLFKLIFDVMVYFQDLLNCFEIFEVILLKNYLN